MSPESVIVVTQQPPNVLAEVNSNFLVSLNTTFAIGKEPGKCFREEIETFCGAWLISVWMAKIVDRLLPMPNEVTTLFSLFPQIWKSPDH